MNEYNDADLLKVLNRLTSPYILDFPPYIPHLSPEWNNQTNAVKKYYGRLTRP